MQVVKVRTAEPGAAGCSAGTDVCRGVTGKRDRNRELRNHRSQLRLRFVKFYISLLCVEGRRHILMLIVSYVNVTNTR